jgi:hypothetical protein
MKRVYESLDVELRHQKLRKVRVVFVGVILTLLISCFIVIISEVESEFVEVEAVVDSIGVNHGADGMIRYFVCVVNDGTVVNVFEHGNYGVVIGDRVLLRRNERKFDVIGSSFEFVKVIKSDY